MGRTRGKANQCLYRARILLTAWESQRAGRAYPEDRLLEAFLPAVRLHLAEAYGWFLLSVSGVEESVIDEPPLRVSDLPEPASGKMRAPELAEFSSLEATGWLGDMLDSAPAPVGATGGTGALPVNALMLVSDRQSPGFAVAAKWAESLAGIMARMDDSLAEC